MGLWPLRRVPQWECGWADAAVLVACAPWATLRSLRRAPRERRSRSCSVYTGGGHSVASAVRPGYTRCATLAPRRAIVIPALDEISTEPSLQQHLDCAFPIRRALSCFSLCLASPASRALLRMQRRSAWRPCLSRPLVQGLLRGELAHTRAATVQSTEVERGLSAHV